MDLAAFLDAVRTRVEPPAVVTDAADIATWLTDWRGRWTGVSPVLLQPSTCEEVVEIVQAAEAHGVGLVPQGGNSSMVGGATPPADGSAVLLSLRRMNRIRSIGPDHAVVGVGVEPAVVIAELLVRRLDRRSIPLA